MRLKAVVVRGLFGLFDHSVALHLDERVTIIHAPNGYGKTVLLKLIAGFFGGSMAVFRKVAFEQFELQFDDGCSILINQNEIHTDLKYDRLGRHDRTYTVFMERDGDEQSWNPDVRSEEDARVRSIPPSAFDTYVPHLRRVAPREWRDHGGERLHYDDVLDKYWAHFPASVRRQGHFPEWLQQIRESVHCQLIETQRLMVQRSSPSPGSEHPLVPAVKSYSDALARKISRVLAESATFSQSLDRTFPKRLLDRMHQGAAFLPEKEVRRKLAELELKRARLAQADLLEMSDEGAVLSHDVFDDPTLRIMTEYVDDAERKLAVFDDLLARIELFTELLNNRFTFKRVLSSRECGFLLLDRQGHQLEADALSSGEQHELIIIYNLLFDTKRDTLILIDEPEISLHIAWQKKFLSDLKKIIQLAGIDVVLATHSPQIIGSRVDLTVQLEGPMRG